MLNDYTCNITLWFFAPPCVRVSILGIDEETATAGGGVVDGLCDEDAVCPSGSRAQGLAGCDPLTQKCLCRLGFQLHNGVCVGMSPLMSISLSQ